MKGRLKERREERTRLTKACRDILDTAEQEERSLTAEEEQQWEKMDAEIEAIGAEIERHERQEAREAKLAESRGRRTTPEGPTAGDDPETKPGKPVTLEFRGRKVELAPGSPAHTRAGAPYRQAVEQYLLNGVTATLHTASDPQGGYLTTTQFVASLIRFLDDEVFMRQLATVLPPLAQATSLGVPTLDTDPNDADWTAEVPASDLSEDTAMSFGKRELKPTLLSKLISVSMKLLRVGVISPEALIRERMGYKFAVTEEKTFLLGTGADQPLGVFTASDDGIGTGRDVTCASATAFTADELIDALYLLKGQYARNATWLFHREALKRIRKLKDGDGQYLWQPGISGGEPSTILSRPYRMSEFAPNTFTASNYVGIIGDFRAGYWIVDSLQMEVQRLSELLARRNKVGFIGRKETDGMPVLAEAFARLKLAAA